MACALAGCGGGSSGPHLPPLTGASAVSVSSTHACALVEGGQARCWGEDVFGQLGDARTTFAVPTPLAVPGLSGLTSVVAGAGYTCGLAADGAVACWGSDVFGEIGDVPPAGGATSVRHLSVSAPTSVAGLGPVAVALATPGDSRSGGAYTCALMSDATVQCWGENTLGLGGEAATSNPPAAIPALSHVRLMALGGTFGCFALDDGSVSCLGAGPLAQALPTVSGAPTPVPGLADVRGLAAGEWHACALLGQGTVSCWGNWRSGESTTLPTTVPALSGVTAIAAGGFETCAILGDGGVSCWGLGPSAGPTRVAGLGGAATSVAVASDVACAVLERGTVECWGQDTDGRLGDGVTPADTPRVSAPVTVVAPADGGA